MIWFLYACTDRLAQKGMDILEYVIEQQNSIPMVRHLIIQAYINNNDSPGGYCTPKFVCTAKALLGRNNKPAETEGRDALDGNLCRCGTYQRHLPAILEFTKNL